MIHRLFEKVKRMGITPDLILSIPLPFSAFFMAAAFAYAKISASGLAQRYILDQMAASAAEGAVLMLFFGFVCSNIVRRKIKKMQREQKF